MSVTVECPHCGRHHKLEAHAVGRLRRCDCGQSYRVPGPPGEPVAPALPKPESRLIIDARRIIVAIALGGLILWAVGGLRDVATVQIIEHSDPGSPAPEALWKPSITQVDRLIKDLSDDDPNRARSAGIRLGKVGEPVLDRVLEVFRGQDDDAVRAAGQALAGIGRPAVPHLIAALKDDDAVAVATAASALSAIGKEDATAIVGASDLLMVAVRRHTLAVRSTPRVASSGGGVSAHDRRNAEIARIENEAKAVAAALRALGTLGDTRALGMIIHALDNQNRVVGQAAAGAVKAFGPAAVAPLIAAWRRGEAHTEWGVTALQSTEDPRTVDLLIQALPTNLGWRAAQALGTIGDQRAAEPLLGVLQDAAANRKARAWAADSLGKLKYAPAVPALVAGLDDPETSVQRASAEALGAIGDKSAVMPLIFAPQRKDPTTIANAATSLGQLGDRRASGPLIALLDHREQSVRVAAITALGALGDTRAIKPLIGVMLEEGRGSESFAVRKALKEIGAPAAPALVQALLATAEDRQKRSQVHEILSDMREGALDALVAGLDAPDCPARKELIGLLQLLAREHPRAQEAIERVTAANGG